MKVVWGPVLAVLRVLSILAVKAWSGLGAGWLAEAEGLEGRHLRAEGLEGQQWKAEGWHLKAD